MFCTGFPSGSAFSIESSLWSGGANLVLHQLTLEISVGRCREPRVADPFALLRGVFWWSRLLVQRLCRTAHSLWRAPWFGMISLRSCACYLDCAPIHFKVI